MSHAAEQIEEIKEDGNHITAILSYADLFQLGGYAAVEYCGGPSMIFKIGRKDLQEHEIPSEGLLPDAHDRPNIMDRMLRTG